MREISEFIYEFFMKPIDVYSGYNPINTIVYAAVLLIVAFKLVFPWLKKNWKINFKFALSLLAYIIFGCSFRILEDMRLLPRSSNPLNIYFYTVSPGIWILIGLITIFSLVLSKKIAQLSKHSAENIFMLIGIFLALPFLIFDLFFFKEFLGVVLILISTFALVCLVLLLNKKFDIFKDEKLNNLTIFAHIFDGTTTVIATTIFACWEQHFLPRALLQINPLLFPLIKILLVIFLVRLADEELKDLQLRNFTKIVVFILGLSTGFRDLLTLAVGTCG